MHSRPWPLSRWKSHSGSVSFQVDTTGIPALLITSFVICKQPVSKLAARPSHTSCHTGRVARTCCLLNGMKCHAMPRCDPAHLHWGWHRYTGNPIALILL